MEFWERVKKARLHKGLTQKELADRIEISQTAINKIERDRSKSSRRTVKIAQATGVNPIWLSEGKGDMLEGISDSLSTFTVDALYSTASNSSTSGGIARLPLLSEHEVWLREVHPGQIKHELIQFVHVPHTRKLSNKCFAFKIIGDFMENELVEGDIVCVDPLLTPKNKSIILVATPEEQTLSLHARIYILEMGLKLLKPCNPRYPIVELTDDNLIKGVVFCKFKAFI